MAKKVGIFVCDCNKSLPIDIGAITRSLNLPAKPKLYSRLRRDDIHPLKYHAQKEKYDRLLIGCCGEREFFLHELSTIGFQAEQIQFLNLKEECFWVTRTGRQLIGRQPGSSGRAWRRPRRANRCRRGRSGRGT